MYLQFFLQFRLKQKQRGGIREPYFDCTEVHRLLDDFMVVMQLQCCCIHGFIERPSVGGVLLGQHLFQDGVTVFEVVAQFALFAPLLQELSVVQVFLRGFDGSAGAFASGDHLAVFGVQQGSWRLTSAGCDSTGGGSGSVGFPLYPLLLEASKITKN